MFVITYYWYAAITFSLIFGFLSSCNFSLPYVNIFLIYYFQFIYIPYAPDILAGYFTRATQSHKWLPKILTIRNFISYIYIIYYIYFHKATISRKAFRINLLLPCCNAKFLIDIIIGIISFSFLYFQFS